MTYVPSSKQQDILDADDAVLLVLGAAGAGKTTTAAVKARKHLEQRSFARVPTARTAGAHPLERVLFLSFSRSSVARILHRSRAVLGTFAGQVEVTTFHALSWSLIRRFGSLIDMPEPYLLSNAQAKLFSAPNALRYVDLVPKAHELLKVPAVAAHVTARWSLVICDEFQDTDDGQWALIEAIRGRSQIMLLGDPNQCIYANLPGAVGVSPERIDVVKAMLGTRCIELPEASFRDPTGVIPAAALAIRRREFAGPAVEAALSSGVLEIRHDPDPGNESATVARAVEELQAGGLSIAIFSHHNDALAALSDQLRREGVEHEIAGLSESLSAAVEAQIAMAQFAVGVHEWTVVLQHLAIFITSAVRGKQVPSLAYQVLDRQVGSPLLTKRLDDLRQRLTGQRVDEALRIAAAAHTDLGLPTKRSAWARAVTLVLPMSAAARRRAHGASDAVVLSTIDQMVTEQRSILLTEDAHETDAAVQLMNLHQTKGREADATVVILRGNDFFGFERAEPYEEGSRLLYVVFSRARQRIVALTFGAGHSGLVAPFVALAQDASTSRPSLPL